LLSRAAHPGLGRSITLRKITASLESSIVDRLEDMDVELFGLGRVEWHAQSHEGVGKTLHADTDGTVTEVGTTGLRSRVVVDVDDTVQIVCHDPGNLAKLLEVKLTILDVSRQGNRSQVTNGSLVRRRVLNDLSAEVRGLDSAEVLLVRLDYEKS
jgi:prophage tail gpP-like protein